VTDRYGVIGNPIEHSQSPFIHGAFAEQTDQALTYERFLASDVKAFEAFVDAFPATGGKGLNVTVPYKEVAFALAAQRTVRASIAGAVNTLWYGPDGALWGDNTDGVGLIRDLESNNGVSLPGARILLLGAGGAARGAAAALLMRGPARLSIANRTVARANDLARSLQALTSAASDPQSTSDVADQAIRAFPTWRSTLIEGLGFADLRTRVFDVIINATSMGLSGGAPAVPVTAMKPGGTCYDMIYGDGALPFLNWAEVAGATRRIDGLGMLVEQAASAFRIWRDAQPDTRPVIASLRRAMSER
jgi:shikimate dehydrogenase